jgi:hypothetical protein
MIFLDSPCSSLTMMMYSDVSVDSNSYRKRKNVRLDEMTSEIVLASPIRIGDMKEILRVAIFDSRDSLFTAM